MWFIYILECNDDSFYTGITNDIKKRFAAHKAGTASRYTRSRGAKRIVYKEKVSTKSEALKREFFLKKLSRTQKLALLKTKGLESCFLDKSTPGFVM